MMTLEEAIKHCKDVALSCTNKECALDHFQLLKWLQEYSNMLEKQGEQKELSQSKVTKISDTKTKRIDWNDYDKDMIKALILIFKANKDAYWNIEGNHNDVVKADEIIAWLESLKDND